MATITLSDKAPKDAGVISFNFAEDEFQLEGTESHESEDPGLISNARVHPWLDVEVPVVANEVADDYDPNDPHDNPRADHLSPLATQEVKDAAAANEAAIMAEAFPERVVEEEPVAAPVASTFSTPSFTSVGTSTDDEEND